MSDYKKMYLKMFRASEQATNILIAAQRECEELYISSHESDFEIIPLMEKNKTAWMRSNSKSTLLIDAKSNHNINFCKKSEKIFIL